MDRFPRQYTFVNKHMKVQKPFVITVIGPESSGKTTLARKLAASYGCPWIPEYAREYLERHGSAYDETDLEKIAEGQYSAFQQFYQITDPVFHSDVFEMERRLSDVPGVSALRFYREDFGHHPRPILIADSGMVTLKLWARIKYGKTIPLVEHAMKTDETSLYLLCRAVLPWEPDPLREAPSILERAWIYNQYLQEMVTLQRQ